MVKGREGLTQNIMTPPFLIFTQHFFLELIFLCRVLFIVLNVLRCLRLTAEIYI